LQSTSEANRNIYTLDPSTTPFSLKTFITSHLTNDDLAVATDVERIDIVNFIRAGELDSNYTLFGWKLGDIFHASPMSIASPNEYFIDKIDQSTTKAFETFRTDPDHVRTSANGKRVILVGANDGQLHAFKTGAVSGTSGGGSELWSFIPPNLLSRLKYITHSTHPTKLTHEYFVDGPLSAAEIWFGESQTAKKENEWKTYLIMGEGRGGISTLWSTSTACDSGFSSAYKNYYSNGTFVPYGNYCGYYAFDVTDTSAAPVFKWRLGGNAAVSSTETGIGAYLGQAWSKMFIGRVKISGVETWVGFIGGGYSGVSCTGGSGCDTRGKGFFVVKLSDGTILQSFTRGSSNVTGAMNYDLAGNPNVVDYDGDGFLDTAYIGDTGGNIWRFKFCEAASSSSCDTNSWTGSLLLNEH
jgi:Tfp pilus tip-associated adhesin PilY1